VGPQASLDTFWRKEKFLAMLGTGPWFLGCPACTIVTVLSMLFWLHRSYSGDGIFSVQFSSHGVTILCGLIFELVVVFKLIVQNISPPTPHRYR
jgi:hypothetical protein